MSFINYGDPMMMQMHHHHMRYDEFEHLRTELEQEDRSRESLEWSNGELERSIAELETYVRELDENTRGIDDNEWKVRYESQVGMNKQMSEQKDWLETELAEARRKLTTGSYPEAMNFNLDALSEAELLRLVKHLERMRNDFYSTLRDTEWKLDKESKEFHHFDEMRRVYKADLKHANGQIERMRLNILDTSGMVSSLYPPGYFQWLDSHTPAPGGGAGKSPYGGEGSKAAGGGGSKSPTRKPGGSKSKGERSPSRSPTRSKSRNEKKTKKKEEPPPEEATTTNKSETENENPTEEEEEEEQKPPPPQKETGHGSPKKKHSISEPIEGSSYKEELPSPTRPKRESSKDRSDRSNE